MIDPKLLKERLQIDRGNLDDEVAKQPVLFFDISEQYAESIAEHDTAKEYLASTDAMLDSEIRENAKAGEKLTETMVKNMVQLDVSHAEAQAKFLAAKLKMNKLLALKDAFKQRGDMFKVMGQLHATSYFEQSSVQDKQVYDKRRRILAEARTEKK